MVMGTAMEKSWWRLEDEPKELADGLEMGGGAEGKETSTVRPRFCAESNVPV